MLWFIENFNFINKQRRKKLKESNLCQLLATYACANTCKWTHTYVHANMYKTDTLNLVFLFIMYFVW